MKKILGISLVALLAVSPMVASAAGLNEEPLNREDPHVTPAQSADYVTANAGPKYALKQANPTNDVKPATAGYVKGAYNAVIKGINASSDEVNTLKTGVSTYGQAVENLAGEIANIKEGYAERTGLINGLRAATVTDAAVDTSSLTGLTSIVAVASQTSATASGTIGLAMDVMDDWETDALHQSAVSAEATFANVPVSNISLSVGEATVSGTVAKSGIELDIDVDQYHAG